MNDPRLERAGLVAAQLKARGQTIAVGESSAEGLITAALLAVPGASAYCRGGLVVYTRNALVSLRSIDVAKLDTMRAATEAYARFEAQTLRSHFETDWGLGETGAAGPTGNKYGDAAGHVCLAVAGPGLGPTHGAIVERSRPPETGSPHRPGNSPHCPPPPPLTPPRSTPSWASPTSSAALWTAAPRPSPMRWRWLPCTPSPSWRKPSKVRSWLPPMPVPR